jgi:hypothetical protein
LQDELNKDVEMSVLVFSIDFDGCLGHQEFYETQDCDLIKANQPFLHYLADLGRTYEDKVLMIGSSRQSSFIDFMSQKGNRQLLRCFPYYLQIAGFLGIHFDSLLMADVYANLAPGTAYNLELAVDYPFKDKDDFSKYHMKALAFQASQRSPVPPDAFCDVSKVSLIYAQVHKMAHKYYPNLVVFKFFDDDLKNLNGIYAIFHRYPDLLPLNLRLDLCQYDGDELKDLYSLQGSGALDQDFYQTVLDIKRQGHLSPWDNSKDLSIYFNQNLIELIRDRLSEESETRLGHGVESDFLDGLMVLYQKAKSLEQRQETLAAKTALDLHRDLTHLLYHYQGGKMALKAFVQACQNKIDKARPILSTHRGWSEILVNLLALVLMFAGIGYLMAAAIRRDLLFFKVKTDSLQKLENIEQGLFKIKSEFEGC